MPIYFYWGEDDFAVEKAIAAIRDNTLDPMWASFNYNVISPEEPHAVIQALNLAVTPPFGAGGRLVWLANTDVCQQSDEDVLAELQRTVSVIPPETILLLTSRNKPDERLKSTKLLKQHAKFQEYPSIQPWKTEELVQAARKAAQTVGVKLTDESIEAIASAVGNDTRLLYNELEKLRLYAEGKSNPLDVNIVNQLVRNAAQNSLQLAAAIRVGDTAKALMLVADLINAAEPPLKIVATVIGQFRTWLWVKILTESGERDSNAIAKAAEVGNARRIYFLQQEVKLLSLRQLVTVLPILLELEVSLKQGSPELPTLQTKVIELCQVCKRG